MEDFRARFGSPANVYRAPARVNLIGEHTDYNDGFVLPAAIEFYCWIAAAPRSDRNLVIHSENFSETIETSIDSISPSGKKHWSNYPLGVAWSLERSGRRLRGANILVSGDVPLGAGLSSSAAIEVAVGFALLHENGHAIDRLDLAKLCQQAESEFVGTRCGIMDQFVSCHGRASHAVLIDCRSLKSEFVKLPPGIQLVICNTMVKHELGTSEYNVRRAECEERVRKLREVLPEIRALRDVTLAQLGQHRGILDPKVYARCRHILTENARVLAAVQTFERGDLSTLGTLMRDSHFSLRDDYEVSCRELDLMVEVAVAQRGVIGARMTGGGFGGCTVNLVESDSVDAFKENVAAEYLSKTGLRPEIYVSRSCDGAEMLGLNGKESGQEQRIGS